MNKTTPSAKHRSRAAALGLNEHFTDGEWVALLSSFDNSCLGCGVSFDDTDATVDHVIPLSKGGTNTIDNIQPPCMSCNHWKHTKHIDYRIAFIDQEAAALLPRRPSGRPMTVKKKVLTVTVRFPKDMANVLRRMAKHEHRSTSAQLLHMLHGNPEFQKELERLRSAQSVAQQVN